MKKFYTLALLVPVALAANARQLSPQEAIARLGHDSSSAPVATMSVKAALPVMTMSRDGFTSLYVFDNGSKGYMVVSADDCAVPLLGYSDTDSFDVDNMPPQLRWWLDFYAAEIQYAAQNDAAPAAAQSRPDRAPIAPLVTTRWNQDAPYNDDCPMDNGARSVTGCVATAMAQAMKYHNWPEKGKGSNSYSWNNETLSLNFANITFDWDNMTDTYSSSSTSAQNKAVAELMYACGVSVDMDYTSDESGASSLNIAPALYEYFDYSGAMVQPERTFYGLIDWENMVYDQLSQGMPVLYGGQSNEGGHQFVCDGYSSDGYFHFNWGWAGESDGYYLLSALDPLTQGIGGSTTGFNYDQGIVINMQPASQSTVKAVPLFYCYGDFEAESQSAQVGGQATFASSQAFYNFGCKSETVAMGVKIAGNGSTVYAAGRQATYKALSGVEDYSVTIPADLSDGTYTVSPAVKASTSGEWTDVLAPLAGIQSLTMTVSGGNITFSEGQAPDVQVTDFTLASDIYLGTNFKATFTVTNNGSQEYYGQLMMGLISSEGNLADETASALAVDVNAGETSDELTFIGTFGSQVESQSGYAQTVEPGTYTLVVFDYLTDAIVYEYPEQVTVQSAPTSTQLAVTDFSLAGEITDISAVTFTGTVECESGYYANQLKVAIFPQGATSTSLEGSSDFIFLSEGQSSDFSATANLTGNHPGQYFAIVYDANNNQLSNALTFTLPDSVAGIGDAIGDASAAPTRYYNLQGVEIGADNLTPGFYIVRQGSSVSKIRVD